MIATVEFLPRKISCLGSLSVLSFALGVPLDPVVTTSVKSATPVVLIRRDGAGMRVRRCEILNARPDNRAAGQTQKGRPRAMPPVQLNRRLPPAR
jgi:hypothetical protein